MKKQYTSEIGTITLYGVLGLLLYLFILKNNIGAVSDVLSLGDTLPFKSIVVLLVTAACLFLSCSFLIVKTQISNGKSLFQMLTELTSIISQNIFLLFSNNPDPLGFKKQEKTVQIKDKAEEKKGKKGKNEDIVEIAPVVSFASIEYKEDLIYSILTAVFFAVYFISSFGILLFYMPNLFLNGYIQNFDFSTIEISINIIQTLQLSLSLIFKITIFFIFYFVFVLFFLLINGFIFADIVNNTGEINSKNDNILKKGFLSILMGILLFSLVNTVKNIYTNPNTNLGAKIFKIE